MNLKEETLEKNTIYTGRIITVRNDTALLPNGKRASREVVEHPGGVTIAALTPEGELLCVRQYRYPSGEALLELPAGKLERGEDPLESGKRELREETGAQAKHFRDIGKFYPTPGYCGEIIHMYFASGLTFGEQALDADEFLTVQRIPLAKAVRMVLENEIRDGKTQAALLKVDSLLRAGALEA